MYVVIHALLQQEQRQQQQYLGFSSKKYRKTQLQATGQMDKTTTYETDSTITRMFVSIYWRLKIGSVTDTISIVVHAVILSMICPHKKYRMGCGESAVQRGAMDAMYCLAWKILCFRSDNNNIIGHLRRKMLSRFSRMFHICWIMHYKQDLLSITATCVNMSNGTNDCDNDLNRKEGESVMFATATMHLTYKLKSKPSNRIS
uniref:Uncharacterized protein n=1 Tax=Glossina austeni TaxID=7395 RepID=A0A1A9UED7_GLOAU